MHEKSNIVDPDGAMLLYKVMQFPLQIVVLRDR